MGEQRGSSEIVDESVLRDILTRASRGRFVNFAKDVMPELNLTWFHYVYYIILGLFAAGKIKKLIVSVPPQHGKSQGSSRLLPAFILGQNPNKRIAIGSYAATIAQDFNRDVQKIIDSERYREIFPDTALNGSNLVTIANGYLRNSTVFEIVNHKGSLRAVGRGGALTSKTVDIAILDDVYKDYAEGNSPVVRQAAWYWYTTVVRSRLHNDSQELIVFTRWNEDDLIGRIENSGETIITVESWSDLENIPFGAWVKINFEAIKESEPTEIDPRQRGEALFPEMHSKEKLLSSKNLDEVAFNCLYQGNPSSAEGRLYKPFKTWTTREEWGTYIRSGNYTDVADEGNDYLFSVCYDIVKSESTVFNEKTKKFEPLIYALITDMEYTKENTDVTTITVPAMINRNGCQKAWIESNSGGAQFEKTIKKKVKALTFPFYQAGNKESRIITNSAMVNMHIVFPFGWENRFKNIYDDLTKFLRDFKANTHDDIADGLTGVYEKEIADGNLKGYNRMARGISVRK